MANIIIEPINTTTSGGFKATISSINPTNSDCFEGTVQTLGAGLKYVRWDLSGICRDNHDSLNLVMRNNETYDLRETAKRLGTTA